MLSHMLMGKQMIRAILIIAVALRTESEIQSLVIKLGSSAYCTAVSCPAVLTSRIPDLLLEMLAPPDIRW